MINARLERSGVVDLQGELGRIGSRFDKNTVKRVFRKTSRAYRMKLKRDPTPKSDKPHSFGGAKFFPGNLRRSFRELKLSRIRNAKAILIGAKRTKINKGDQFRGQKVNGFYAHFPEFGIAGKKKYTPIQYQKKAWESENENIAVDSLNEFKRIVES